MLHGHLILSLAIEYVDQYNQDRWIFDAIKKERFDFSTSSD